MRLERMIPGLLLMASLWGSAAWSQENEDADEPMVVEESVDAPPIEEVVSDEEEESEELTSEYRRELLGVEQSVYGLKERVFRSKATLQLLKELVVEGATLGSRVAIWHINRLGGAFSMESMQYFLDGKNIYSKVDPSGALSDLREVKVREQTVAPGAHTLQVNMVLVGKGYGVFTYLESYRFRVQSSYAFDVADGEYTTVRVIADRKKGVGQSFVERANVQYETWSERMKSE